MNEVGSQAKEAIDALSIEELRHEVNLGRDSRFQREKFAYAQTRLRQLEAQEEASRHGEEIELQKRHVEAAQEANEISRAANRKSFIAILLSLASLALAAYVAMSA